MVICSCRTFSSSPLLFTEGWVMNRKNTGRLADQNRIPYRFALSSSVIITLMNLAYFCMILVLFLQGVVPLPPPESAQVFGGVISILSGVLFILLFAAIHIIAPADRKMFTLAGTIFCAVFSVFIFINRFVQFAVVRRSVIEGNAEGLQRFMPYDSQSARSAMFALEFIGWAVFLGLALLFLCFVVRGRGVNRAVRCIFISYFIIALFSGIAYMAGSALAGVGFFAWGVLLFIGTALLSLSLWKYDKYWAS